MPIIDLTKLKNIIKSPPKTIEELDKLLENNKKYFKLFLKTIPSNLKNKIFKEDEEISDEEIFEIGKTILIQIIKPHFDNIGYYYNIIKSILNNIDFNKFLLFNNLILSFNKYKDNIKLILINSFLNNCEEFSYINLFSLNQNIDYINNYYQLNKKEILINEQTYKKYKKLVHQFIKNQKKNYYKLENNINLETISNLFNQKISKSDFYDLINKFIDDDLIKNYYIGLNTSEEYNKWLKKSSETELKKKFKKELSYLDNYKIKQILDYNINIFKEIDKIGGIDNYLSELNINLSDLNKEINDKYNINKFINNCLKNNNINYYLQYLFDVSKIETNVKMNMYALNITNIGIVPNFKEYLKKNRCNELEYLCSKIKEN